MFPKFNINLINNCMSVFKKGDRVECVDDSEDKVLKKNNFYTVSECAANDHISLKELGYLEELCCIGYYKSSRFVLAKEKPNYMMVWERKEKNAIKTEVVANLNNNPRFNGNYAVVTINLSGETVLFRHCKSIEQWRKDNVLFTNSLGEDFFENSVVYWIKKSTNKIFSANISTVLMTGLEDGKTFTEIMTKKSAEKYVKEHEVVVVEMTMEEVCRELGKNIKIVK